MDPLREVALSISNETSEAGIARPSACETMPLQRADREAEDLCRLFLGEESVHACSAATEFVRQNKYAAQFCRKGLANLAMKVFGEFSPEAGFLANDEDERILLV